MLRKIIRGDDNYYSSIFTKGIEVLVEKVNEQYGENVATLKIRLFIEWSFPLRFLCSFLIKNSKLY